MRDGGYLVPYKPQCEFALAIVDFLSCVDVNYTHYLIILDIYAIHAFL